MTTASTPRLPPNKLSQAVREHVHYPTPGAAEEALVAILADGNCRAAAHAEVGYFGENGKPLDFSLIISAIRPKDLANARELEDNAIDPAGKRRGFGGRRRGIAPNAAVAAQGNANTSPKDSSRRTGKTGSGGGRQNKQKMRPTPGMAPSGSGSA